MFLLVFSNHQNVVVTNYLLKLFIDMLKFGIQGKSRFQNNEGELGWIERHAVRLVVRRHAVAAASDTLKFEFVSTSYIWLL